MSQTPLGSSMTPPPTSAENHSRLSGRRDCWSTHGPKHGNPHPRQWAVSDCHLGRQVPCRGDGLPRLCCRVLYDRARLGGARPSEHLWEVGKRVASRTSASLPYGFPYLREAHTQPDERHRDTYRPCLTTALLCQNATAFLHASVRGF
jgi:hypothetical protein